MDMTLAGLIRAIRFRLSEVLVGDERGLWSDDEIKDLINEAQVVIARDCHSTVRLPWLSSHQNKIPVLSGADRYYMPYDFLSPESIWHYKEEYFPRRLKKGNIKSYKPHPNFTGYDSQYVHYEIRGKDSPFIAHGVASATSERELIDIRGTFNDVRVGDIVHNTTDESTSEVVGFTAGKIILDNWVGGTSHKFYAGDGYKVQQAERNHYLCWVWPVQRFKDPIAHEGTPYNFSVNQDRVINGLEIQFERLPENWQEDSRVTVVVHDDQGNLADERVESIFSSRIRLGYNQIGEGFEFRLNQDRNYFVKAYIIPEDMPEIDIDRGLADKTIFSESENVYDEDTADYVQAVNYYLNIKSVKLRHSIGDYLEVNYVPRPRALTNPKSISEFPPEALSVMVAYAKTIAWEKKDPDGRMHVQMQNIYENQLQKFIDFMELIDESGNDSISPAEEDYYTTSPGFTEFYGDVQW